MLALLSVIKSLWSKRRIIGIGLAAVALIAAVAYVINLRNDLVTTTASLKTANIAIETKDAQLKDLKATAQEALDYITALNKKNEARLRAAKTRERDIRNVPKTDDGPVAPVLRDGLNRMRGTPEN